jgi:putative endonuclease
LRSPLPHLIISLLSKYEDFSAYVYIMQSTSRHALYIGVTNNIEHRVWQHKSDLIDGFTRTYQCHRLVYFERFGYVKDSIAREKQLKGWTRAKKEALITKTNPLWLDLAADWKHQWSPENPNGVKLSPN